MELKSGFKLSEVGIVPLDWRVVQLGDVNPFVTSGSRGWARYYAEYGDLFVRITNLSRQSIYLNLTDCRFINLPPDAREGVRTQLQEHDVLISITADIGIVGYVDQSVPEPAYINQHIALVRFDPETVSGRFVSYFLASETPRKSFRALTDTGAKAGMNLLTVRRIHTALPRLPEQRAIAEALGDVDALLASLDRLIAKKRDIKQAVMQQLLTGDTRLPGFSGEWEAKQLGDVVQEIKGGGTPSRGVSAYWGGEIPWATVKDFATFSSHGTQEYITKAGLKNSASNLIPAGTLITATRMALGKAVVYEVDVAINQDLKALFFNQHADVRFMRCWFEYFGRLIDDIGGGSTVKGISIGELRSLSFLAPEPSEQREIATVLEDISAELGALSLRREKANLLKQGMMQELLTGRTRLV